MSKGRFPGMGQMGNMGNMGNMLKQAQKMQQDMMQKQEELDNKEIEVTAGGGAIKVLVSGKKELLSIKINPEVVDSDDVEMLEDLIMAAVNEAIRKADEMVKSEMGKITGGLGLPF